MSPRPHVCQYPKASRCDRRGRRPRPRHTGFTLVEVLVVITIIGTLVGLLIPAIQAAREASRQSVCTNNLKQYALAMHGHHDAMKVLPYFGQRHNNPEVNVGDATGLLPSGTSSTTATRSFIVPLWPFMEQTDLTARWTMTANHSDTANRDLSQTRLPVYFCPSDRPGALYISSNSDYNTSRGNYVVNLGPSRAFVANARRAPFGIKSGDAVHLFVPYRTKLSDMTDGLSKTLLMGEVRFPPADGDGTAATIDARGSAVSHYYNAFFTAASQPNGGSDRIRASRAMQTALPRIDAGDDNPSNLEMVARSRHPGGVYVAFGDAAVQFIPDTIQLGVWQELSTMNSGTTAGTW